MSKKDPLKSVPDEFQSEATDLYELLDVSPDEPTSVIKGEYKEKIKEYHPDHSDHPNAQEITLALNRAIKVIGDQNERILYDQLGHKEYFNSASESISSSYADSNDKTKSDTSLYEIIRMTNFEAHTGNNEWWVKRAVTCTGFKLLFFGVIVVIGLVWVLVTV